MPGTGKPRAANWTAAEDAQAVAHPDYDAYAAAGGARSPGAWRNRRFDLKRGAVARPMVARAQPPEAPPMAWDKADPGGFSWRDANRTIGELQAFKRAVSSSQDTARIVFAVDHPICVVALSDAHIGSWGTDHDLFARITDEILATPNLYVALLGDMAQMAIRLSHGILALSDNLLPTELQLRYVESWLAEIEHKVLFSTWDNHAVEREEQATGYSRYADIMKRKVVYHNGIGHPDIVVGGQTYRLAVSHRFRGRSLYSPVHALQRYMTMTAADRELGMQGDTHVAGMMTWTHGETTKVAINSGTTQVASGYARRHFSLTTHPVFPCVVLYPDEKIMTPFWSIADWLRATTRPAGGR